MLRVLALTLMLCGVSMLRAQDRPYPFGEIPKADLMMTVYDRDSLAPALVLVNYGLAATSDNDQQYILLTTRHRRLKILKPAGLEYANVTIPYYHADDTEFVHAIKAQTITPDGRKYPISQKDIFREKVNDRWSQVKFALPNAAVGSVIEWEWAVTSKNIIVPDSWHFREELPVRYSQYMFANNTPHTYQYYLEGLNFAQPEKRPDGSVQYRKGEMSLLIDKSKFILHNSPALREEPFLTAIHNYQGFVRFQLAELVMPGRRESYLSTWEDIARKLMESDQFGQQLQRKRSHQNLLAAAAAAVDAAAPVRERVEQARRFLDSRVRWNGNHGIFTNGHLDAAFQRGEASVAELQLMAVAILRQAGVEAHPALTATRAFQEVRPKYPYVEQFDYLLACVNVEGNYLLLDMTDPTLPLGLVREEALNHHALLVKDGGATQWITIAMPNFPMVMGYDLVLEEDRLKGQIKAVYNGYSAQNDRHALKEKKLEELWTERLHAGNEDAQLLTAEVEDNAQNGRLTESVTFSVPTQEGAAGDYLYINPVLYAPLAENPFTNPERILPVDFGYPRSQRVVVKFTWPETYELVATPEMATATLPNGSGSFLVQVMKQDSGLSLSYSLDIKKDLYLPEEYEALRALFVKLAASLEEPVVLRRKG